MGENGSGSGSDSFDGGLGPVGAGWDTRITFGKKGENSVARQMGQRGSISADLGRIRR